MGQNAWENRQYANVGQNAWGNQQYTSVGQNAWGNQQYLNVGQNAWGNQQYPNVGQNAWENQQYPNVGQNAWENQQYPNSNMYNQGYYGNQHMYGAPNSLYNQPVSSRYNYNNQIKLNGEKTVQQIKLPSIKIRNIWSLIAAILLAFPIFGSNYVKVEDYGDWIKTFSLAEFCTRMSDSVDGQFEILGKIAACTYYFVIASLILLAISTFVDVSKYKKIAVTLLAVSTSIMLVLMWSKAIYVGDKYSIGTDCVILLVGIGLGIKSYYTDNSPKHSLLSSDSDGLNLGEWRCSKCDTRNMGFTCKVCGSSKDNF